MRTSAMSRLTSTTSHFKNEELVMSEIYEERLADNMPIYMDNSAMRKSLVEALNTVLEGQDPQEIAIQLAELKAIASEKDMDWLWQQCLEVRGLDGKDI